MVKNIIKNGRSLLTRRQTTILSAALVIMVMLAASRVLGLVRNRILAHFFSAEVLALYFAAFRLPELIFEILVFGTLSSAFIPTFTSYLSNEGRKQAWQVASVILRLGLIIFLFLAAIIFVLSPFIYRVIAAGFTSDELVQVVALTRILLLTQGLFVVSYFFTGVLESLQRFVMPAVAPLFYNLGIIFGAIFLASEYGLYGPVLGSVIGAFGHLLVQLPLAVRLGFKFSVKFDFRHPGVRKIGKLAAPRMIELSFLQVGKIAQLFLASLISTAAYTYFTFADSLQVLPVSLFGASIAKASLPSLSSQAAAKDLARFKKTFLSSFNEILFLVVPCAVFLAVLRIPLVRLVFGSARFTWTSTVETGHALSAFSIGIFSQAIIYLLTRAFYALHETVTPVRVSIGAIFLNILLSSVFVLGFHWSAWSLAFSFSVSSIFQALILVLLLKKKRLPDLESRKLFLPFVKILSSSLAAGGVMFFLLKMLDRSAWDKRLSFLGRFGLALPTSFDRFAFDTRYTPNLILLTFLVAAIGGSVYLISAWVLRIEEVTVFSKLILRLRGLKFTKQVEKEAITIEDEQA